MNNTAKYTINKEKLMRYHKINIFLNKNQYMRNYLNQNFISTVDSGRDEYIISNYL